MVNYIEIQNKIIEEYKINIVKSSTCWHRSHAHCDGTRRICKWIQSNGYVSLVSLLHELGHIECFKKGMTRAEDETVATRFQIKKLKELGLPIKRKMIREYKHYIKEEYERALRRGLKRRIKSRLLM